MCYYEMEEILGNYKNSFMWFNRAAHKGDASAQYMLGYMYLNGKGAKRDKLEAIVWFRRAARQGDSEARVTLRHLGETW